MKPALLLRPCAAAVLLLAVHTSAQVSAPPPAASAFIRTNFLTSGDAATARAGLGIVTSNWAFNTGQLEAPGNQLQVKAGAPITNATLAGLPVGNAASFSNILGVANVTLPPWNADATGVADATAVIQSALYYAALSNGAPRKLWLPQGTYKLTTALNIPTNSHLEILGDGTTTGYNPNAARTILRQTATTNGLQWIGSASALNLARLQIHDLAIIGPTNSSTGAGIWVGQNFQGDYGAVQGMEVKNVGLFGFKNGIELHDVVTPKLEAVHSMWNTNASFYLARADSADLKDCWGGWDPQAGVTQTCIVNIGNPGGSGFGVNVWGGEWGNCYQWLYGDGVTMTVMGGNRESLYTTKGIVQLTNQCQYSEVGVRWASLTNLTAPIWRVFNNPVGQYNSGIVILNPTIPYQTAILSVEGPPAGEMPMLLAPAYNGYTNMVYRSTIGGAVTTGYADPSSIADKNQTGTWTKKQTLIGASGTAAPLRVQSGSQNGGIELGGDMNALTLTANATKLATIAAAPYSGTGYTVGVLQLLGDVSGNYLDLGQALGLTTVDVMRFFVGGSARWTMFNTGWLQASGAFGIQTPYMLVPTNTFPVQANFANLGNGGAILWNSNGVHGYWIATNSVAGTATTNQAW